MKFTKIHSILILEFVLIVFVMRNVNDSSVKGEALFYV